MKNILIALLQVGDNIWIKVNPYNQSSTYHKYTIIKIEELKIHCKKDQYSFTFSINKSEIYYDNLRNVLYVDKYDFA